MGFDGFEIHHAFGVDSGSGSGFTELKSFLTTFFNCFLN
jgi:hypothetical protein